MVSPGAIYGGCGCYMESGWGAPAPAPAQSSAPHTTAFFSSKIIGICCRVILPYLSSSLHTLSTAATTVLGANPGEWTIIFLALPRAETKFTSRDTLEQVEGKFSAPVMREGGGRPVHDGSAVSSLTPGVTMTLQPRPCSQLYHRWHNCTIGVSAEIK